MTDTTKEQNDRDNSDYDRERAAAEDDGTALLERADDLPPSDLYHAAFALAELLADDLPQQAEYIGLVDLDPARWELLDVARAADYARRNRATGFAELTTRFPWLGKAADQSFGALGDSF